MSNGHARILPDGVCFKWSLLGRYTINVHRPIAALCGDILVQGIPGNALHKMTMLGDFTNALACKALARTHECHERPRQNTPSFALNMRGGVICAPSD